MSENILLWILGGICSVIYFEIKSIQRRQEKLDHKLDAALIDVSKELREYKRNQRELQRKIESRPCLNGVNCFETK